MQAIVVDNLDASIKNEHWKITKKIKSYIGLPAYIFASIWRLVFNVFHFS